MGATIYPAHYDETTGHLVPSLVTTYTDDPMYGRIPDYNPFEVHLSYSTIMDLFDYLGYEVASDQYSGVYKLSDFEHAVGNAIAEYYASDEPPNGEDDRTFAKWQAALLRVCLGARLNGSTHIIWN